MLEASSKTKGTNKTAPLFGDAACAPKNSGMRGGQRGEKKEGGGGGDRGHEGIPGGGYKARTRACTCTCTHDS
jgi:hypothetical protein